MRALLQAMPALLLTTSACSPLVVVGSDDQALLGAAVEAVCAGSLSYERTREPGGGQCLRWLGRSMTYHVDAQGNAATPGEEEFAAIDRAFATWGLASEDCSDWSFVAGPRAAQASAAIDGRTEIVFRQQRCEDVVSAADPCWSDAGCGNQYDCWAHQDSSAAVTTSTFRMSTGELLDGDVELNAAGFLFTTVDAPACPSSSADSTCVAMDLQATMTHEIGHLLGLNHSDDAASTMSAAMGQGDLMKRSLDSGSRCFLCQVYPRGQPSRSCPAP